MIKINPFGTPVPPPPMPLGINVVYETPKTCVTDSKIGEGASGAVMWGFSKYSGSPFVVKTLADRTAAQYEISALKMGIPHTTGYRDDFENTSTQATHIVMDQVNERNIYDAFLSPTSAKRLTLPEIRSIASQTLEFLAHLAKKNLIHYDIKPDNMIWITASNSLIVVDLASVREAGKEYEIDHDITPEYFAPEAILEGKETSSYDIWSLGCVLFELIVGRQLFIRDNKFLDLDLDDNDFILMQIVNQIGEPSSDYLAGCLGRDECFTEDGKLRRADELPYVPHWSCTVRKALKKHGAQEMEIQEWIKILSSMLCYENRASAKDLLNSPLFIGEIHVNLIYDPRNKCRMHLLSASDQSKGITMDFYSDKNSCLHIPRDPNDKYMLILQNDTKEIKVPVTLKNEGTLDITKYQAQLDPVRTSLMDRFNAGDGESSAKKSRIDSLE